MPKKSPSSTQPASSNSNSRKKAAENPVQITHEKRFGMRKSL